MTLIPALHLVLHKQFVTILLHRCLLGKLISGQSLDEEHILLLHRQQFFNPSSGTATPSTSIPVTDILSANSAE